MPGSVLGKKKSLLVKLRLSLPYGGYIPVLVILNFPQGLA
jgi:hypothetical protein